MCCKKNKKCCPGCGCNAMCKLAVMFTLNFSFFLVELIVGYYTNSMALVADSFHMLSDVAALVVAFIAVKMSSKTWKKNTYGWARAEVLGALVNAVFLIALCFSIVVDSVQRFIKPEDIQDPLLLLVVGTIGLLMNVAGLCIFHDHGHSHGGSSHGHRHSHGGTVEKGRSTHMVHSNRLTRMVSNVETDLESEAAAAAKPAECEVECDDDRTSLYPKSKKSLDKKPTAASTVVDRDEPIIDSTSTKSRRQHIEFKHESGGKGKHKSAEQMNIQGVFMHLLADTLGSVVVVISALVYVFSDWKYRKYIDPSMSIFMVTLILISVYPLLVESALILLQSVPDHIDLDELESKILKQIDGVVGLHELHVWRLAGDRIIATAHIKCRNLSEYYYIAEKVKAVFHNEGIHSTTIQPEFLNQSQRLSQEDNIDCYLSCSALSATTNCSASQCCPPAPPTPEVRAVPSRKSRDTIINMKK